MAKSPCLRECFVDKLPLAFVIGKCLLTGRRERVILPLRPAPDSPQDERTQACAESVKDGVEHPVGPLDLATRQCLHALNDGIAVAVAVFEDGKNQRAADAPTSSLDNFMRGDYIELLCKSR